MIDHDIELELDLAYIPGGGGGGSVDSVNGKTGNVVLTGEDILREAGGKTLKEAIDEKADPSDIPTKVSQLQNDSGYITGVPVESVNGQTGDVVLTGSDIRTESGGKTLNAAIGEKADPEDIPTRVSQLQNDAGYITGVPVESVNGNTGAVVLTGNDILTEDGGETISEAIARKADADAVPSQVSELENDAGYTTFEDVDSEIASATSDMATQTWVEGQGYITSAPVTSVSGKTGAVTLTPSDVGVDLSPYATTEYVDGADESLQTQIDAITSQSDVVDVVATYADLTAYDKPLYVDDIVKVMMDSTHFDAISYYRWKGASASPKWEYIGSQGPFYTKGETDLLLAQKQDTISDLASIRSNASHGESAYNSLSSKLDAARISNETWTFTLDDDSTVTKEVALWISAQ